MPRVSPHRRFAALLALIVVLGFAVRAVYVLRVTQHDHDLYDATYYELQATSIADGDGFFKDPFALLHDPHDSRPAADHPPLTVVALLPGALLHSQLAMRFTMLLVGCVTIVLVAFVGRLVAGATVGLLAAAIAALDPQLWMNDGLLMSESLAALLTVGLLALTYKVLRDGVTPSRAITFGALAGLATLTRIELSIVFLAIAFVTVRTTRQIATTALAFVVVLAPWAAYNVSRFDDLAPISTNGGLALQSANCDSAYYGSRIGYINVLPPCAEPNPGIDQSAWDSHLRANAFTYLRGHLARYPLVVLARLGRAWNVFALGQTADLSSHEGRPTWATGLGAAETWVAAPLAVVGAVALRRRRQRVWPLVVTIVAASAVLALLAGGLVRYRAPAEPAMVVLAAAGAVSLWRGRLG